MATSRIVCMFGAILALSTLYGVWDLVFYSKTTFTRFLLATVIPGLIIDRSFKKKSLSPTGAIAAYFMGFIFTVTNWSYFACLIVFFISSSKATKFRDKEKAIIEGNEFKEGGQRDWVQVLCNGGVAMEITLVHLVVLGSSNSPIDFTHFPAASWFGLSVLGAIACSTGDTWSSEFGTVLSQDNPILITSLQRVPKGTNGGVSLAGLVASFLGGLIIGLTFFVSNYLATPFAEMSACGTSQFILILMGGFGGLFGSLIDSLLGATLQYSGVRECDGSSASHAGKGIRYISGLDVLDNHSVNLISNLFSALLLPALGWILL